MPLIKRDPPTASPASTVSTSVSSRLASESTSERWAAARAMVQEPGAVPLLAEALRTEQAPEVREALFTTLIRIHSIESATALASMIRSDDAQLRTGALDALGGLMDVARPLLPDLLADKDPDVRLLACELVRRVDPEDGTRLLCGMLESETEANVCGAAVGVLSDIADDSAISVLERCATRFASDPYLAFAFADAIERASTRLAPDE